MMAEYMPLNRFKAIYVVDLCHSLCEQAKQKVKQKGWKNVHVVEGDACTFQPPEGIATLVTFSYSLSSTPDFAAGIVKHFSQQAATNVQNGMLIPQQQIEFVLLQWCHHSTLLWTEPSPTLTPMMASLECVTSLFQGGMICHADSSASSDASSGGQHTA